jgi:hypothetical protein
LPQEDTAAHCRPGNVQGGGLNGSIGRLQRDFLYDIVDLMGRILNSRFSLSVHMPRQYLQTKLSGALE